MIFLNLAYDLRDQRSIICGGRHAGELPVEDFDKYVRAIYFPECRTVYFRFWNPSGDYTRRDEYATEKSLTVCDTALRAFTEDRIIPKTTKVLYWQTDKNISEREVSY